MKGRSYAQYLGTIVTLGLVAILLALARGQALAAPEGSPWGANYFPNVQLTTQDGQTVRFYDDLIKNKVVAINFIFTSCSDSCPAETAKLRQVQKLLGERVGRDVFLYSISIDPEHDTPAILKQYAQKFDVGPGWLFLTGKAADIALLRKKLGLLREADDVQDKGDHNTSLIVGNEASGQWMKRSSFDNSLVLAGVIGDWLHNWKVPNTAQAGQRRSYTQAARLAQPTRGEQLFRTRCVACHSVGGGDGLGPDLLGVAERRERAWLTRWLMVPDQMLAEKDPVAVALYARFKELRMPNLRLNELDAEVLIDYLQAQTSRGGKT